jgi:hypothetical protein
MPVTYTRNRAGENYITRARFGPVGRDLGRRTLTVEFVSRRTAPVGEGRAPDRWQAGYPAGGLKRSVHSEVITRRGNLVGIITADAVRPRSIRRESYAAAVHEGSRADYPIVPRRSPKRWLRWPGADGQDVFRRRVIHPGIRRGQPWMRDALEAARG